MHLVYRKPRPETDLAALYQRRESVVALIRSLERYQRAPVRSAHVCSRPEPRTAA
jgi:hypothetical protein